MAESVQSLAVNVIMSLSFGPGIPFVHHMGFTLERFENGHSEMHYAPLPEHLNSFDITHGGALMTLLDVAMATAARSVDPELGVFTIEMKTSFMKAAKTHSGEHLVAKGELIHRTKKMAFAEAKVFDAQGELCAHSTGTFKYAERRPAGQSKISTG
jgi:uncharacterized protein (TIGR00369 family)